MEEYFAGKYDVAVIGAGHAGVEAALAAARLGVKTCIFTLNLDKIANMPCRSVYSVLTFEVFGNGFRLGRRLYDN